jgi:hypothetical protein
MLIVETINTCNAACVFCAYTKQQRQRGVMEQALFERILSDYASLGGGNLSLTPMVGDVLLDPLLMKRMEALRSRPSIRPSLTTNLFALHRLDDEELSVLLNSIVKIHVSVYGRDFNECKALTKTRQHDKFVGNLRRLADMSNRATSPLLALGFRLSGPATDEELVGLIREWCGRDIPFTKMWSYANWGNALAGRLPGEAHYLPPVENTVACALLAVAVQVFWDGRLSNCACCDYDACTDLRIGDARTETLADAYNGAAAERLWNAHLAGELPPVCRSCTFHVPLSQVGPDHPIANEFVLDFVGG